MNKGSNDIDLDPESQESSLDLEQTWFVIREKIWLIALCGLIGIFAGLAYIHRTPITYYAQTVLDVDPQPMKVVNNSEVREEEDPLSDEMVQTVLAVFRSRSFAEEVVERNHLLENPDFLPPLPNGGKHGMDEGVGTLLGMTKATVQQGTRFINVGAMHPNPLMAKEIADMMANTYILHTMEQRDATSSLGLKYLQQKAAEASASLAASQAALQDYVKAKNEGSLVEANDTVVAGLKSKNSELSAAHTVRLRLEADDEEVQKHVNDPDPEALLSIPSVANYPTIAQARQMIKELLTRIDVLKLEYTPKHPKMIQAMTELDDEKRILLDNIKKMPALIHMQREQAEAMEDKFAAEVKAQEAAAMKLDDDHIHVDVLSRNIETDQALYDSILTQLKEAKVATGSESTNVHVFEPALVPGGPMQKSKSLILTAALAGGLVLGLLLAIGLHRLDSSVKTVDQAEDVLGLTVLASIPRQGPSRLKESGLSLVKAPGSVVAEAFRSLRTAVYLAGRSKGRKIVLFTSTVASEGKTFCSTNYATALAQQGLRTLLIDADLRSPMVGAVLLSGRKLPGLTDLLSRKVDISTGIHQTEVENLFVLPAGELVPNPAELLARSDVAELIRQLGELFDRIVIDTAPVTAVSDTLLLLEHAQSICLVVHAGKTPRKWLLRAIKLINEAGSKPDGAILNQVPMRVAAYSYYPGKYGEPGVYGTNGKHKGSPSEEKPEIAEATPRF